MRSVASRPDPIRAAADPATSRRQTGWLWRLLSLASLVATIAAWPGPHPTQPPPPQATPYIRSVAPETGRDGAFAQLILARPLFAPTRRPPPPSEAPLQAQASAALPRLAGTIIRSDGYRAAVLVPPGSDHPATLREGDRLDGLQILQISAGEIVANAGIGLVVLPLSYDGPSGAASPILINPLGHRTRAPGEQDE